MFPKSLSFEPISTAQNYCVSGDVAIYAGVAIAPGVLLQADVGSRIVIRSGVCIGLGCVIHAHQGTITIHEGANLGAGVLLIGDVTIGARACLGAAVTVLNSAIDAGKIVESGMVVGDRSRQVDINVDINHVDDVLCSIPMNEAPSQASKPSFEPIITDTTGNPWQSCDPDPWDPSDHPPSETTCQVTSKPKDATPFDGTIYSAQNFSSPYPPYQNPPTPSTHPPIATSMEPTESDISSVEMNSSVESDVKPDLKPETKPEETAIVPKDEAPKPVYGQAYVNQMLGRMLGR